jgi:hypothetical protein
LVFSFVAGALQLNLHLNLGTNSQSNK